MRIAFIHPQSAFLPEITAYSKFFTARGISCELIDPRLEDHPEKKEIADCYWYFMGIHREKKSGLTIHEYTSASVPPFAGIKNKFKKMVNSSPDYRLFLNNYVREQFSFSDQVPEGIRDMGIPAEWLRVQEKAGPKKYDFIYLGELNHRNIQPLLSAFKQGAMKNRSLLILSNHYETFSCECRSFHNIHFAGPVAYGEVRNYIDQASFGLNYVPDREPFNQQTSTKFLEYAAARLPIITTDYDWVRRFKNEYGGNYFFLEKDLSNFKWGNIVEYYYSFPDLSSWTWDQKIRSSGILEFLDKNFEGLNLSAS